MSRDPTAFYSTVAGLLPVLLLAMTLEGRMIGRTITAESPTLRTVAFGLVVAFSVIAIGGEALCFHVLLGGRATERVQDLTLFAVIGAATIVLLTILRRAASEADVPDATFAVAMVVVIAGLAGQILIATL